MSVPLTTEIAVDKSMANSEQPSVFSESVSLSDVVSWPEDLDEKQSFTETDFKAALKKVSRKIKR